MKTFPKQREARGQSNFKNFQGVQITSLGFTQLRDRAAGKWLTKELKNKTPEIKAISESDSQTGKINGIGEVQIFTVEDILEKTFVTRNIINHVEDLY